MPRKKPPTKFRYTRRKDGNLYVVYPLKGLKYPVWRICRAETQEAVNQIIDEIKADFERIRIENAPPEISGDFFAFWLKLKKPEISERTFDGYEGKVRRYLAPAFGNRSLSSLTSFELQTFFNELAEKLESETLRNIYTLFAAILKEAVHFELLAKNPLLRVKRPAKKYSERLKSLTQTQAKDFLEKCETFKHGIVFRFALETGMRPEEYLALRWSDIDLSRRTAQVMRAVVFNKRGGGFYFKEPKTTKSRRTVPFSEPLQNALHIYKEKQTEFIAELQAKLKAKTKPSLAKRKEYTRQILKNARELDLVFPSSDFTPIKNYNLSRRYFRPIAEKCGIDKSLAPYCLRHTMATLLLQENVNPKIVSERLGHASIAQTLDTYSHVLPTIQEIAVDKLSEMLY